MQQNFEELYAGFEAFLERKHKGAQEHKPKAQIKGYMLCERCRFHQSGSCPGYLAGTSSCLYI